MAIPGVRNKLERDVEERVRDEESEFCTFVGTQASWLERMKSKERKPSRGQMEKRKTFTGSRPP